MSAMLLLTWSVADQLALRSKMHKQDHTLTELALPSGFFGFLSCSHPACTYGKTHFWSSVGTPTSQPPTLFRRHQFHRDAGGDDHPKLEASHETCQSAPAYPNSGNLNRSGLQSQITTHSSQSCQRQQICLFRGALNLVPPWGLTITLPDENRT